MFKRLREALEAALASATPPEDLFDLAGRMRAALVEARAGLGQMRDALEKTERELALAQRRLFELFQSNQGTLQALAEDWMDPAAHDEEDAVAPPWRC